MDMIDRAAQFAADAHRGQMRKYGHSDRPYVTHPARVAARVSIVAGATEEMVAAAWLHDVMEDCGVSFEELVDRFGAKVAGLVVELTNPSKAFPDLPRAERKEMDRKHIAEVSWEAKVIKLADRVDNIMESLDDPEAPADFLDLYVRESKRLLEVLRGVDEELENELEARLNPGGDSPPESVLKAKCRLCGSEEVYFIGSRQSQCFDCGALCCDGQQWQDKENEGR